MSLLLKPRTTRGGLSEVAVIDRAVTHVLRKYCQFESSSFVLFESFVVVTRFYSIPFEPRW